MSGASSCSAEPYTISGSRLTRRQDGFAPLEIGARWAGRFFEAPSCYAWRLSRHGGRGAWGLHVAHLKIHLENTIPEVERFAASHGCNPLSLERGVERGGFMLLAGADAVIAHPAPTVRGRTRDEPRGGPFGGGYFVTGPTLALGVARGVALGRRWRLAAEARFTVSWARVPIADGRATVPSRALHVVVGLGFVF